jgi:hypothetical protein
MDDIGTCLIKNPSMLTNYIAWNESVIMLRIESAILRTDAQKKMLHVVLLQLLPLFEGLEGGVSGILNM